MICIAFLKRDILHTGTFRENEGIGLSLRRDFGFVIMQNIRWEKSRNCCLNLSCFSA